MCKQTSLFCVDDLLVYCTIPKQNGCRCSLYGFRSFRSYFGCVNILKRNFSEDRQTKVISRNQVVWFKVSLTKLFYVIEINIKC